jgi:hypothetical protein
MNTRTLLHAAFPLLAALALLLAGCSSNFTNLREQFSPTYQRFEVEADQRAAYDAAVAALARMGFKVTSGGAAQGKIEAISGVAPDDSLQNASKQTTASARFSAAADNRTAVEILFTELRDGGYAAPGGYATKQPLASSPLYTVFQNCLVAALKKP